MIRHRFDRTRHRDRGPVGLRGERALRQRAWVEEMGLGAAAHLPKDLGALEDEARRSALDAAWKSALETLQSLLDDT